MAADPKTPLASIVDWRQYEKEIEAELGAKYPRAFVKHNVRLRGKRSAVERQIDVLLEENLHGTTSVTAVEAKYHARPLDVKAVDSFIGLLHDVDVDRGVIISPRGYTKAALSRAYQDDVDVDLDIFTLDEFKQWQADGAVPYAGNTGVVIPAPFGWVLEIGPVGDALARLYRRGLDFRQAYKLAEFMYVNIWDRDDLAHNLDLLLEKQERDILTSFPDARIVVEDFAARNDFRTCLRRAEIPEYPSVELTAFVEFPRGILFVVMFSPLVVERRNLRKLEHMLRATVHLEVQHAT